MRVSFDRIVHLRKPPTKCEVGRSRGSGAGGKAWTKPRHPCQPPACRSSACQALRRVQRHRDGCLGTEVWHAACPREMRPWPGQPGLRGMHSATAYCAQSSIRDTKRFQRSRRRPMGSRDGHWGCTWSKRGRKARSGGKPLSCKAGRHAPHLAQRALVPLDICARQDGTAAGRASCRRTRSGVGPSSASVGEWLRHTHHHGGLETAMASPPAAHAASECHSASTCPTHHLFSCAHRADRRDRQHKEPVASRLSLAQIRLLATEFPSSTA